MLCRNLCPHKRAAKEGNVKLPRTEVAARHITLKLTWLGFGITINECNEVFLAKVVKPNHHSIDCVDPEFLDQSLEVALPVADYVQKQVAR